LITQGFSDAICVFSKIGVGRVTAQTGTGRDNFDMQIIVHVEQRRGRLAVKLHIMKKMKGNSYESVKVFYARHIAAGAGFHVPFSPGIVIEAWAALLDD
jgi:hypothetical protein